MTDKKAILLKWMREYEHLQNARLYASRKDKIIYTIPIIPTFQRQKRVCTLLENGTPKMEAVSLKGNACYRNNLFLRV